MGAADNLDAASATSPGVRGVAGRFLGCGDGDGAEDERDEGGDGATGAVGIMGAVDGRDEDGDKGAMLRGNCGFVEVGIKWKNV